MKRYVGFLIILLLLCGAAHAAAVEDGRYSAELLPDKSVSLRADGRELFRLSGVDSMSFNADVTMQFGFFKFKKKGIKAAPMEFAAGNEGIDLVLGGKRVGAVTLKTTTMGSMRVTIAYDGPTQDGEGALRLRFACAPDDRFWGFGEQYNYVDMRGQTVPIWVQEEGVGRTKTNSYPPRGGFTDSYFPMPYFMDPVKGKGLLVENKEYAVFNLCTKRQDAWDVEVWNKRRVSLLTFPGPKPIDVIEQLTAEVGRPKMPPADWVFEGVWLGAQRGWDVVDQRVDTALKAGIPVSAVWVQDWVGERHFGVGNYGVKYHWAWDSELYPDMRKRIRTLENRGVRFLGYFNPFIAEDYDQFGEAKQKGYLVKKKNGEPYVFQIITFKGGLLDVTNPDAVAWFKTFARTAVEMGMYGWMCDFGEWLPYDAVMYDGITGAAAHNTYATTWHRINREVLEERYVGGEYALLTRSGYTREQGVAQIVWAGDQEQDWKDEDGLPTVVTAALTIGLAGVPYFTTDIAGFSGGPSTKELFMRWTELGAFMPVMRTHDGLKKFENHRFDSDAETLAHFTKMAKIHAALLPYLKKLSADAVRYGLPMIRHTVLVDSEWEGALEANRQWMLGPDVLFAPVVKEGAVNVEVSFPEGEWEHLLTGERFKGRQKATVSAPIGTPAVFVRVGKLDAIAQKTREIYNAK